MSNFKVRAFTGVATVALGLVSMAGAASATNLYGGGASLPANYIRQAEDCFGQTTDLVFFGTPPTEVAINEFNYQGTPPQDCSVDKVDPGDTIFYISTGSGAGIRGYYSHDTSFWGDTDPNQSGTQLYPKVTYALSETSLGATEVNAYRNGGTVQSVTVVAPGGNPGPGQYPNPNEKYGQMIQIPALIAAVAISYDDVYKKVKTETGVDRYRFNIRYPRNDLPGGASSGGLRLDALAYCRIFNGEITNWNHGSLKVLNGNQSLEDPTDPAPASEFDVPLQIVGRSDSSGTTSLWTRHLAAACQPLVGNGLNANVYADSTSTLPAGIRAGVYDKTTDTLTTPEVLGKYTTANGNDGVAQYVNFDRNPQNVGNQLVQGRMGYNGNDFVLPYVLQLGGNTFDLNSATLKNAAGKFRAPTPDTASDAFADLNPPQSSASGAYDPGGAGSRANPADWVEPASKLSPLANPTAGGAYPIVGTSNFLLYTCYKAGKDERDLKEFLTYYYTSPTIDDTRTPDLGILAASGFAPMPKDFSKAIRETFLKNKYDLDLDIDKAGGTAQCAGKPGA